MSTLISAARWIQDGARGEITEDALQGIRQVLANYEQATRSMHPEKH